jgi:hypothetical protein
LLDKLDINSQAYKKLYVHLEDALDWRPKENLALQKIIQPHSSKPYFADLIRIFLKKGEVMPDVQNYTVALAEKIYKLRNSIAHWRPIFNDREYDYINFNDLLFRMCELIDDVYMYYRNQLNELWHEKAIKAKDTVIFEETRVGNKITIRVAKV